MTDPAQALDRWVEWWDETRGIRMFVFGFLSALFLVWLGR